jgi:ribosomal protein S18 acetylase RimI-like enzyme
MGLVRLMRHPEADIPQVSYWLYSLTVRTRYRGMGIGEALTRRVIEQARAEGALELFLRVFEDNAPALALYRKLGFEQVTLPALDADLVADVQKYRRRRLPLRKPLG